MLGSLCQKTKPFFKIPHNIFGIFQPYAQTDYGFAGICRFFDAAVFSYCNQDINYLQKKLLSGHYLKCPDLTRRNFNFQGFTCRCQSKTRNI